MVRAPLKIDTTFASKRNLHEQVITALNHPLRILHVDDTEGVLHLQRLYLQRHSKPLFDYVGVVDSDTALQTIPSWRPDLVLSDISRPCMDGFTFTKLLKSRPDTSHIPVVILSASGGQQAVDHAYAVGAVAYFTKPSFPHLPKIHRLAAQHRLANILDHITPEHQLELLQKIMATPDVDYTMRVEIQRWMQASV